MRIIFQLTEYLLCDKVYSPVNGMQSNFWWLKKTLEHTFLYMDTSADSEAWSHWESKQSQTFPAEMNSWLTLETVLFSYPPRNEHFPGPQQWTQITSRSVHLRILVTLRVPVSPSPKPPWNRVPWTTTHKCTPSPWNQSWRVGQVSLRFCFWDAPRDMSHIYK